MSQRQIRLLKSHKESYLEDILKNLNYEKSVFIQSDLENDQFAFLIQNLKKLSNLTEFGIQTAYKSLSESSLLSLLAKEIKNLSQLTKLKLKLERPIEDRDSSKILIELGDSLQNLNNLEDLALEFGNMKLFSEIGAINLTTGFNSLQILNKFHISMYVYNQQEENFIKEILSSSIKKEVTELSIHIIKYVEKGKEEKATLYSQNIFNLSEFAQLNHLKLSIDKKIKNYEFDLKGFVNSLEYLKNLNKIYLNIDQMSFKQVNFSEFYDRLFQIVSLEELETRLVISQIDKEITLGEKMSEISQLKTLNLKLVNKGKKSTLKFGQNISKYNQFRKLQLDFKQIELSECGQQVFFQNLQKLQQFTSKLEMESLTPSFVENLQFLHQLKAIKFAINNIQQQIASKILPFFKSIKNLTNLEIIEVCCGLGYLVTSQEDFEDCFKNLVNLRDFKILQTNSYDVIKNFQLIAPLLKNLTQVERLQAVLEIVEIPDQLKLISQNLGQLISLKSLNLRVISYMHYNEYQLRQEDIQNLLDGISNLINLESLNIYFDTNFNNYNFLYQNLSAVVQNLTQLRYLAVNGGSKLHSMNNIFKLKSLVFFNYFTYW
ncbi:hypothetical protein TTHERM_000013667 (macronuclear) [Tetrahymena thermophila SB210]|uniref:Kinase domain protein n=1 Tax=Tetrahymena thermophila (strain SB210) TaxID=312017 RepID=W7XKB3_TETTS|nr:hypothetical protein TTHERM_000013667 [Tetrahymena thermophila SB210]EWS76356.1 hypothetical protein TTHERM_000013667 [Tetrahymena thermophila SB210]|eukprot:XP_012651140.1 hypothetical protein TTHERM_000013667 [Tetrahymena thermophila SB210]